MFCIHKIYKLQVKPTDTTSINLGICCKIPFFRAFTVSDYSRSRPESRNRCVKILCLSCLWAQAKRSVQAASVSLLEASGAECKERFEAFCLSLTCSVNAGSTRSLCRRRRSFKQMEPRLRCFVNKVSRAKLHLLCGVRQYLHAVSFP